MPIRDIADLSVGDLAADDAHLYLWTVSCHLRDAYTVADAWGFKVSQVLTWAKIPRGFSPGGIFASTSEFILFCRRGSLKPISRPDRSWWDWARGPHSVKPPAFYDLVERVSPGPYLELFARQPRLGWDSWGFGYEDIPQRTKP
jgi:N6-adenosine-specific RNA methylase IME4